MQGHHSDSDTSSGSRGGGGLEHAHAQPHAHARREHAHGRRASTAGPDLWAAARSGTGHDVDVSLAALKRHGGNVNSRNALGATALHLATWRNHLPIVLKLLEAGADPDARDAESGWSSLHRALHFGHLTVAAALLATGASLNVEDTKGRTPIDLISGPLSVVVGQAGATEVSAWGNGANYQLGTGTAGIYRTPCRIDALQGVHVAAVAAARFHSLCVTAKGELYSWGFGRGGRLGHPDFDIHSGQVAVIAPRLVAGLSSQRVRAVAAAKHHTVVATEGGDVYSWGSNREGRLGYNSVDSQPTPRKVSTLRSRVSLVAASNKHTAVITDGGEVFTWGCNSEGQLGYGTCNSASNCTPRVVESLKGKRVMAVAAAKYHTVVLTSEGEVHTWGYKSVMPQRVAIMRDTRKAGSTHLRFHKRKKQKVVAIAAGFVHSSVLAEDGLAFYWVSADPLLRCHQVAALSGKQAVAVSAGKYRTAVVTSMGDVFAWEGEKDKPKAAPKPFSIPGMKHASNISVGELHSLALAQLYIAPYPPASTAQPLARTTRAYAEGTPEEEDFDDNDFDEIKPQRDAVTVPALKDLCQYIVATSVVEPRNALQILEIADSLGADSLKAYCELMIMRNLGHILTVSPAQLAQRQPSVLASLEAVLAASSNQPWSYRSLPTSTGGPPVTIAADEEEEGLPEWNLRSGGRPEQVQMNKSTRPTGTEFAGGEHCRARPVLEGSPLGSFWQTPDDAQVVIGRHVRAVRKKLQQIEALEAKQGRGLPLDLQQKAKLRSKLELQDALKELEAGQLPHTEELDSGKKKGGCKDVALSPQEAERVDERWESSRRRASRTRKESRGARLKGQRRSVGRSPSLGREDRKTNSRERNSGCQQEQQQETQKMATPQEQCHDASPTISEVTIDVQDKVYGEPPLPGTPASCLEFKHSAPMQQTCEAPGDSTVDCAGPSSRTLNKKKARKGGLSMFLSGALENPPSVPLSPSISKLEPKVVLVWGKASGSKAPKASSLLEIQSQQQLLTTRQSNFTAATTSALASAPVPARTSASPARRLSSQGGHHSGGSSTEVAPRPGALRSHGKQENALDDTGHVLRVPLSQFVRSSPIAVSMKNVSPKKDSEHLPAWSRGSAADTTPSLRDIQVQQEQKNQQRKQAVSRAGSHVGSPLSSGTSPIVAAHHSPHADSLGTSLSSASPSRWYRPEEASLTSLRSIQMEEEATSHLRRAFGKT
eukprot:SM000030S11486  [mRNA]  locus=s30:883932:890292:- [translate_table: standard]